MRIYFPKIKDIFFILFLFGFGKMHAQDNLSKSITNPESQIVVESTNQRSDFNNSIFYAEGNVLITNTDKEFIAKSNKAIIHKSDGKIQLIGNVEFTTNGSNKVQAAEMIFFLKEKKFEAASDLNQRVKTTFNFEEKNLTNSPKD